MIRRSGPESGVFVGIASFGTRTRMLKTAVESLIDQVDRMGVYLNDYPEVPAFLQHPRIDVVRSQDHGDQRDNGKFFFLGRNDLRYYAAADDDLKYPPDYITRMKSALVDTGSMSAVAVHGAVYPTPIIDLFHSRRLFHYAESLQHIMPVHLVGTGTVLFDQQEWNLGFDEFGDPGMADIWFVRSARRRGGRLFVINRNQEWLMDLDTDGKVTRTRAGRSSLYAEFRFRTDRHIELLREAGVGADGYEGLIGSILQSDALTAKLTASQALAFEDLRQDVGWPTLDDETGGQMEKRLTDLWKDWSKNTSIPDAAATVHAQTIAAILTGTPSGDAASALLGSLEHLAALHRSEPGAWNGLPYSLRFDSREHRLEQVRQGLIATTIRSAGDLTELWPRVSLHRRTLAPRAALAFEQAGFDTGFQSLPRLRGLSNPNRAGDLLLAYFEGSDWSVPPDMLAWRQIFGDAFDTKPVQVLVSVGAALSGHREMATRYLDRLTHRWPADPDVALLAAMLEALEGRSVTEAILPALRHLDRLVEEVGLRPYSELLQESSRAPAHWIDLLAPSLAPTTGTTSSRPEVSVIMTVYNGEETVKAAASSVLASIDVDLELLIVDDASTDQTRVRVEEIDHPRVRLISNDDNFGPYVSRNRALEVASGEFVTIADADDWTHPDRIAYQRDRLQSAPYLWACTVSQLRVKPNGVPDLENHLLFLGDGPMSLMFRRRVVDQIGGFDHIRTRGDMEFMSRLVARFGKGALAAFGVPLVLSTASPISNSKRFSSDSLDRYRLAFRRWHEVAALSDALYVSLRGNRAPFIAPAELVVTDG